ncbi:hypothetical protein BJF79_42840 [Actinomadura sp. CNU-125]|nr:hypothetical protein BJF79_42840 [Actinomadura sp. CNU-125]
MLVAVLALVALTAFEPVLPLAAAARRFVELGDAARRLLAVLDGGTGGAATRVPDGSVAGPVEVGVEDVVVRYPGAAEPVLRISLRLPPGRGRCWSAPAARARAPCWRCCCVSWIPRPDGSWWGTGTCGTSPTPNCAGRCPG